MCQGRFSTWPSTPGKLRLMLALGFGLRYAFTRMNSHDEVDGPLSPTVLDNRKQRSRMQAELVLIQSLALALDAQMSFEMTAEKQVLGPKEI